MSVLSVQLQSRHIAPSASFVAGDLVLALPVQRALPSARSPWESILEMKASQPAIEWWPWFRQEVASHSASQDDHPCEVFETVVLELKLLAGHLLGSGRPLGSCLDCLSR